MQVKLRNLYAKMQGLVQEEGQDLIEYALVVGLIAFGAAAAMNQVATSLNTAFSNMAGVISNSVS